MNIRIQRFYDIVRAGLHNALTAIKHEGNLAIKLDIETLTETLLNVANGLNVVIRSADNNALIKLWLTRSEN